MPHRPIVLRRARFALPGFLLALASLTSGCAVASGQDPPPAAQAEQFHDPLENVNRAIFHFNDAVVDRFILTPIGTVYRTVLPRQVRDSLHNLFRNARGPIIFANDLLQGDVAGARNTLARFVINSTIGIGGLIDIAGHAGIPYHYQDFGVTFGVWGIEPGPYLVLPVLGPSDPRDLVGNVAESFADPGNIAAAQNGEHVVIYARGGASGVDTYARNMKSLKEIKRTSIDYYAAIRSLYQQRRAAFIERKGGVLPPNPGLASNGEGVAVTVKPLPPPATLLAEGRESPPDPGPAPTHDAAAAGAELFPPRAEVARPAPSRRIAAGAELFPPRDLVAEGKEPSPPAP
jgi:phospholipid-binding lipoprotein MlaA